MEERERELVDRNENLLIHNIILTEEFYNQLRWNQVLPDCMISDVQVCIISKYKLNSFNLKWLNYILFLLVAFH